MTCPSGKLKAEFTSPKEKSTSPGLSDTIFFARCGWIVLIKGEILITAGMVWLASFDKWKAH